MTPHVGQLPDGSKGFDANCRIGPKTAAAFKAHDFTFANRYVPRATGAGSHDLTAGEVVTLLEAGLGVGAVQHVESESSWIPTLAKGTANGDAAADAVGACGLLLGTTVWCDLEGVDPSISAGQVSDYCHEWYTRVATVGFTPGLYVGWHCGLNAQQLYALPFRLYWSSYNLDGDQYPAVRGVCMRQHAATGADRFAGCPDIDTDTIHADRLGGSPLLVLP